MLTVEQLIKALQKYPSNLRVVVDGYEGGFEDIDESSLTQCELALDINKGSKFFGPHEEAEIELKYNMDNKFFEIADALVINRDKTGEA